MSSETVIIYQGKAYPLESIPSSVGKTVIDLLSKQVDKKNQVPELSTIACIDDFADAAEARIPADIWAYYRTGSDDEITLQENTAALRRIYFRPRILNNVTEVDQSTTILGSKSTTPFYITAFAQSIDGHPEGEKNFTRGARATGVIQMIPLALGFPFDEIVDEAAPDQNLWLQVYVSSDREENRKLLERAKARGIKAIFVTVDTAQLGNRESERKQLGGGNIDVLLPQDPALSWDDIGELKTIVGDDIKIILKGVQTKEDALKAYYHAGVDGILISNHGGRQLDTARSSIEVLHEVRTALDENDIPESFEVLIDGGFRRGTDIVKALCLGASGIGLGRPFLYSASAYGHEGVIKAVELLKDEIDLTLRLLGVTSVLQLHKGYLDLAALKNRV